MCLAAVFLIAFMRGAFGGGFAIVGIPLLSLVTDAVTAGALLAPLFVAMDVAAIRYWKPSTWSKPDLAVLVPSLLFHFRSGKRIHFMADWNFCLIPPVWLYYKCGQVITVDRKPARPRFLNVFKRLFTDRVPASDRARARLIHESQVPAYIT